MEPIYELVVPIFFVLTGTRVEPSLFTDSSTIGTVAIITTLAIAGKLAGCGGAAWGMSPRAMLQVGVGMVPRGEVGIIVASIGLSSQIIDARMYGVVVAMSIIMTLITPPTLKVLYGPPPQRVEDAGRRTAEVEGIGG